MNVSADELWVISDLHLSAVTPDLTNLLLLLCDQLQERQLDSNRHLALMILGDLFDAWIGDDLLHHDQTRDQAREQATQDPILIASRDHAYRVIARLASLGEHGIDVYFMAGNRDFLLQQAFCARAKMRLLPDPFILPLFGHMTAFSHGDILCTDDVDYQTWRRTAQDPAWQQAFLSQPLEQRWLIAQQLRQRSEQDKSHKASTIMDVNPQAVRQAVLRGHWPHGEYQAVERLIHGHTHRPGCYSVNTGDLITPGSASPSEALRWVLPDWHAGMSSWKGLKIDARGIEQLQV